MKKSKKAHYHLPGLFEFYEFYKVFLPVYYEHPEFFYDFCDIGSIYGAPADCLWGGGRTGFGDDNAEDVINLLNEYGISARLTFSNSLIRPEHLLDKKCNDLCRLFNDSSSIKKNGVIIHSELLLSHIAEKYKNLYFVSSTTKVITDFDEFVSELARDEFDYTVIDFRLNKEFPRLSTLSDKEKSKTEFLVNECCSISCPDRKACYESVSRKALSEDVDDFVCRQDKTGEGYVFSKAMKNRAFISIEDIQNRYMHMGFSEFKIEGRSLGSALLLEFILYYMTKPECVLNVRELIYLDNTLDLF